MRNSGAQVQINMQVMRDVGRMSIPAEVVVIGHG
jgi:hypothetical protein